MIGPLIPIRFSSIEGQEKAYTLISQLWENPYDPQRRELQRIFRGIEEYARLGYSFFACPLPVDFVAAMHCIGTLPHVIHRPFGLSSEVDLGGKSWCCVRFLLPGSFCERGDLADQCERKQKDVASPIIGPEPFEGHALIRINAHAALQLIREWTGRKDIGVESLEIEQMLRLCICDMCEEDRKAYAKRPSLPKESSAPARSPL